MFLFKKSWLSSSIGSMWLCAESLWFAVAVSSQADQERLLEEEKRRQEEQLKVGFMGVRSNIHRLLAGWQLLGLAWLWLKMTDKLVIFRNGRSILAPKSFCTPPKLTQTNIDMNVSNHMLVDLHRNAWLAKSWWFFDGLKNQRWSKYPQLSRTWRILWCQIVEAELKSLTDSGAVAGS